MRINDKQLAVVEQLIRGKTLEETAALTGVSLSTVKRYKSKFGAVLAENDAAISSMLLEARSQSLELMTSALDELQELMTVENTLEKLAVIRETFRAFQLLNPPVPQGNVTISNSGGIEQENKVVVYLPDNGRGLQS